MHPHDSLEHTGRNRCIVPHQSLIYLFSFPAEFSF
jgi:hypothetical protein